VTTALVVVISGGPGTVDVPNEVNQPCSSADSALTTAGFNVNSQFTYQTNPSFAAQTVITTDPQPGTPEQRGTSITITCSSGAGTPTTGTSTTASPSTSSSSTANNGGFIAGFNGGDGGNN
jgi:beta-lactam-binding protein with PASTA domain